MRMVLAIAAAEARSLRRMPRTWLFAATTFGVGFVTFAHHSMRHTAGSGTSPSWGGVAPAFLVSGFGGLALWTALAGCALLAFDARSRDERAGIAETLDARPVSNLAVLVGRLAAVLLVAWLPLLAMAGAVQLFADVAADGGRRYFESDGPPNPISLDALLADFASSGPPEPLSLANFLALDAPTALILWVAMVTFVAVTLRNRLLVAAVPLSVAGALFWIGFHTPLYLLPATFGPVAFGTVGSDILPAVADGYDAVQRLCLLLAAAGLLVVAAACHARRDAASRLPGLYAGIALMIAGMGGVGALVWLANDRLAERAAWSAAHRELRNAPRADVESVSGHVRIEPGARLEVDVALDLRLPPEEPSQSLTLSLNPGLRVEALQADGAAAAFRHQDGLLAVELPQRSAPGAPVRLALRASGVPDAGFAYLDSALDATRLTLAQSQLHLLGTEAALFEDDYVALMPGIRWLPIPGADFASDDTTAAARRDFFDVDLEVEVPQGWLAAGPGLREQIAGDGAAARFRFRPAAPVHEVAMLAADFARRALTVGDIELELLMHPEHVGNLDAIADGAAELASKLNLVFQTLAEHGLAYPYRGLSVVQTPGRLRGYGGGWRMDTVQSLPGIVLLREHGFPTGFLPSLLALPYSPPITGPSNPRPPLDSRLAGYFADDYGGGDLVRGAVRNLLAFQTAAIGPGADAVDLVAAGLVERLVGTWTRPAVSTTPFSAYAFLGGFPTTVDRVTANTVHLHWQFHLWTPSTWDRVADSSLAAFAAAAHGAPRSAEEAREALNALLLRRHAAVETLHDIVGASSLPAVLGELRRRHAGGGFSAADLDAIARDLGVPLEQGIADWLRETALPGFLVSPAEVRRLADDEWGQPRYQLKLHVRNDEPTPGLVRLQAHSRNEPATSSDSLPIRVAGNAAVEIGLVHPAPPEEMTVKTYLSLNRGPIRVAAPRVDATAAHQATPLTGARPSDWQPRWKDWIVVDDLDAGFGIEEQPGGSTLRDWWRTDAGDVPLDAGLPAYGLSRVPPGRWLRRITLRSWGRYRRTSARVEAGDGRSAAVFVADIPHAGRWRLDYHLPARLVRGYSLLGGRILDRFGRYRMSLAAGGDEQAIDFDADAGDVGWNRLGEFRLEPGEVRLEVSDQTTGDLVVADAIRWRPAEAPRSGGGALP